MLYLYNSLSRKKEIFKPVKDKKVRMYTCGPTVYAYAHLGNLRTYLAEDLLKRALIFNGYQVKQVMNITDVGHLVSDADSGEDKIELAAKKEKKTSFEIADFYTEYFFSALKKLNIIFPEITAKATDHIKDYINYIKLLEEKGFTYFTSDGIYFDTSKLKDYGKLTGQSFKDLSKNLKAGARIEFSSEKKNITDFALWKFSPQNVKREMEWDSPWGKGFPGWHIECAVISLKYLGNCFQNGKFYPEKFETIDIHCGGIDHIPIHHTNEIAEVESLTKKPMARFWFHVNFLVLKETRMGKSEGNALLIEDIEKNTFSPLAFRYLSLTTHYRMPLEFSFESLKGAENSLREIYNFIENCLWEKKFLKNKQNKAFSLKKYSKDFEEAINNDLNTPQALSVLWNLISRYNKVKKDQKKISQLSPSAVYQLLLSFDKVLGLDFKKIKLPKIKKEVQSMVKERENLRKQKKWQAADNYREKIKEKGYLVEDTIFGPRVTKIND